jgi:1-deoxy-D-xylulose-5-phosphate reductoisomerase
MRLPIAYALTWPDRLNYDFPRLNLAELGQMTFTKPDRERFKALDLAYQALERGGNIPCAMNAANEIAVAAFLENKVSFLKIPQIIESVMNEIGYLVSPGLDELKETDKEARLIAGTKI